MIHLVEQYINHLERYRDFNFDFQNYSIVNENPTYSSYEFINPLQLFWDEHIIFLRTFYSKIKPRNLILGLNPGKNGCNKTSIAFTDPTNAIQILGMSITESRVREISSTRLYPLILNTFNQDIQAFFNFFKLSNVFPFGATEPGVNGLKNVKFERLVKIPELKGIAIEHLVGLINIFLPKYIIAVGEDSHKLIREVLREKYPQIIVIQAAHPAVGTFFTKTEKERWQHLLKELSK